MFRRALALRNQKLVFDSGILVGNVGCRVGETTTFVHVSVRARACACVRVV